MKIKLQDMNEKQLARAIKINKFKILIDIFLIVVLFLIMLFVYLNLEEIKTADNVCQVCFEKYNLDCFCYQEGKQVYFDFKSEGETLINTLDLQNSND